MSGKIDSETLREIVPPPAGGYHIVETVREGRLYLAEKEGKRFVLKRPASDSGRDLELLRREWELSVGLSHPGLAYVFTWEADSPLGPCLVEEYVDGRPLSEFLAEGPSSAAQRRVFAQLLSVLAYLHGKGIVHNDLSPANILISRVDDAVKVIDLGYADDSVHYLSKSLGGSRAYASPELLAGEATDARSDIYSLGVLMRTIFPGRYGRIVRRCLRTRPERRYPSVEALEKAWKGYWLPLRALLVVLASIGLGTLVGFLLLQQRDIRALQQDRETERAVSSRMVDSLETAMGSMSETLDSLLLVIEKARAEKSAQEAYLDKARAAADAWYAREIPAFRRALKAAHSQDDVLAAWNALSQKYLRLNTDIPAMVPSDLQGIARDYLLQRSNETFPTLQEEMAARMNELIGAQ